MPGSEGGKEGAGPPAATLEKPAQVSAKPTSLNTEAGTSPPDKTLQDVSGHALVGKKIEDLFGPPQPLIVKEADPMDKRADKDLEEPVTEGVILPPDELRATNWMGRTWRNLTGGGTPTVPPATPPPGGTPDADTDTPDTATTGGGTGGTGGGGTGGGGGGDGNGDLPPGQGPEQQPPPPGERRPTNFRKIETVPPRDREVEPLPPIRRILERICGWYRRRAENYERAFTPEEADALTTDIALYNEYIDAAESDPEMLTLKDKEIVLLGQVEDQSASYQELVRRIDTTTAEIINNPETIDQLREVVALGGPLPGDEGRLEGEIAERLERAAYAQGVLELLRQVTQAEITGNIIAEIRGEKEEGEVITPEEVFTRAEEKRRDRLAEELEETLGQPPTRQQLDEAVAQDKSQQVEGAIRGGIIHDAHREMLARLVGGDVASRIGQLKIEQDNHEWTKLQIRIAENRKGQESVVDRVVGIKREETDERYERAEKLATLEIPGNVTFKQALEKFRNGATERDREEGRAEVEKYLEVAEFFKLLSGAKGDFDREFEQILFDLVSRPDIGHIRKSPHQILMDLIKNKTGDKVAEVTTGATVFEKFRSEKEAEHIMLYFEKARRLALDMGIVLEKDKFEGIIDFYIEQGYLSMQNFLYKQLELPVDELSPLEVVWSSDKYEAQQREQEAKRRAENSWGPTGSGFYQFEARTAEEFEFAADSHIEHLASLPVDPSAILREIEYFGMGLAQWARMRGVDPARITSIRRRYAFQAEGRLGHVFDRSYDARNLVAVVAKLHNTHEAMAHIEEMTKLRKGLVFRARLEQRQSVNPEYELMYRGMGPFGQEASRPHAQIYMTDVLMPERLAKSMVGEMVSDVCVTIPDGKLYGNPLLALDPSTVGRLQEEARVAYEQNLNSLGLDQPYEVLARAYVPKTANLFEEAFGRRLPELLAIRKQQLVTARLAQRLGKMPDEAAIGLEVSKEPDLTLEDLTEEDIKALFSKNELEALRLRDIRSRLEKAEEIAEEESTGLRQDQINARIIEEGSIIPSDNPHLEALLWKVVNGREKPVKTEGGARYAARAFTKSEQDAYDAALSETKQAVQTFRHISSFSGDTTTKSGGSYLCNVEDRYGRKHALVSPRTRETISEIRARLKQVKRLGDRGKNGDTTEPTLDDILRVAFDNAEVAQRVRTALEGNLQPTDLEIEQAAGEEAFVKAGFKSIDEELVGGAADRISETMAEPWGIYAIKKAKQAFSNHNKEITVRIRGARRQIQRTRQQIEEARGAGNAARVTTLTAHAATLEAEVASLATRRISRRDRRYKYLMSLARDNAIHALSEQGWGAKLVDYDIDKLCDEEVRTAINALGTKELDGLIQRVTFRAKDQVGARPLSLQELRVQLFESDIRIRETIGSKIIKKDRNGNIVYLKTKDQSGNDINVNLLVASQSIEGRSREGTYEANQWEIQKAISQGAYVPATIELLKEKVLERKLGLGEGVDVDILTAAELKQQVDGLTAEQVWALVANFSEQQFLGLFVPAEKEIIVLRDKRARLAGKDAVIPSNKGRVLTDEEKAGFAIAIKSDRNITEAARRIRDGESRPEDEDILATIRLIIDPTLDRIKPYDMASQKGEEEFILAQDEESFLDRLGVRRGLSRKFSDMVARERPNSNGATSRLFGPDMWAEANPSRWSPRARALARDFLAIGQGWARQEGMEDYFDISREVNRQYPMYRVISQEIMDGPRLAAMAQSFDIARRENDLYFGAMAQEGARNPHQPGATEKFTLSAERMIRSLTLSKERGEDLDFTGDFVPVVNANGTMDFVDKDGNTERLEFPKDVSKIRQFYDAQLKLGRVPQWFKFNNRHDQESFIKDAREMMETHRMICETFKLVSDNTSSMGAWDARNEDFFEQDEERNLVRVFNPEEFDDVSGARIPKSVGRARHLTNMYVHPALDQLVAVIIPMANGRTPLQGARREYAGQQSWFALIDEVRMDVSYLSPADKALFPEYAEGVSEMIGPTIREFLEGKYGRR